jgi:radical SAM superfamily enzyme YgiQ (UPF0313 family)
VPLNIGFIKAYSVAAHSDSVDIRLFKHPEKLLKELLVERPEIVGLSNYTWNSNLNIAVGRYIREVLPECLIIVGGPNIDDEENRRLAFFRAHDYIDYIVIDGGEEPFAEIVEWWRESRGDRSKLPMNVAWSDGTKIHQTSTRPLKKVIDNIPSPYLSGYLDEFLDAGMTPLFETNRGCPFKCSFCAWGSASKDLVRRLDLDTVLAELEYVSQRSSARNWIFCDANFGILKRDVDIAWAIRRGKDKTGKPTGCHVWTAKNITARILEITEIMGELLLPSMAVQSLDEEVLANINRDNISTETYVAYVRKFQSLGNRTHADLIVPLPGETLESHIGALRKLSDYGLDSIVTYNLRLLPGTSVNFDETKSKFGFKTKFRLIAGEYGAYHCPDGTVLRVFEYEEGVRETTTMDEDDLIYQRKLQFLLDFSWNTGVYKYLLWVARLFGINQIDVICKVLEIVNAPESGKDESERRVSKFFRILERQARGEWYENRSQIESYYMDEENFDQLLENGFEKINILFSVILLRDFKSAFDVVFRNTVGSFGMVPEGILDIASDLSFNIFPPLNVEEVDVEITFPVNIGDLSEKTAAGFTLSGEQRSVRFVDSPARRYTRNIVCDYKGRTLSKALATNEGIELRSLSATVQSALDSDAVFRHAV